MDPFLAFLIEIRLTLLLIKHLVKDKNIWIIIGSIAALSQGK